MDSRKMFSSLLKDGNDENKCDSMGDRTPCFSSLKFVSEESHFNFLFFVSQISKLLHTGCPNAHSAQGELLLVGNFYQ